MVGQFGFATDVVCSELGIPIYIFMQEEGPSFTMRRYDRLTVPACLPGTLASRTTRRIVIAIRMVWPFAGGLRGRRRPRIHSLDKHFVTRTNQWRDGDNEILVIFTEEPQGLHRRGSTRRLV